jgi:hypothetical protein
VNLAAVDRALQAFGIGGGGGYTTCPTGTNTAYISRDMDRNIAIDCWWEPRGAVRSISEATYGQNCGAPAGNATAHVQAVCAEKSMCEYNISQENLGDPAFGCPKNFLVNWVCYSGALEKKLASLAGVRRDHHDDFLRMTARAAGSGRDHFFTG